MFYFESITWEQFHGELNPMVHKWLQNLGSAAFFNLSKQSV